MKPFHLKHKILTTCTVSVIGLSTFAAPAAADHHMEAETSMTEKTVSLINTEGAEIGTVKLTEGKDGVVLLLETDNMPQGVHSFHIHEAAACNLSDFKSAGGHLNPDSVSHGFYAETGPHPGDLPNIHVPESGQLTVEAYNTRVSLSDVEGKINLLDEDGSSIMIHENADDYSSQPTGGGGARIACAEIKAQ